MGGEEGGVKEEGKREGSEMKKTERKSERHCTFTTILKSSNFTCWLKNNPFIAHPKLNHSLPAQ